MPNITTHVTSLELSRRLKELGVPQKSHFYWVSHFHADEVITVKEKDDYYKNVWDDRCSAYLASELGEMLRCSHRTDIFGQQMKYGKNEWRCWVNAKVTITDFVATTEADARALMLIYLIENHLISVEELGK